MEPAPRAAASRGDRRERPSVTAQPGKLHSPRESSRHQSLRPKAVFAVSLSRTSPRKSRYGLRSRCILGFFHSQRFSMYRTTALVLLLSLGSYTSRGEAPAAQRQPAQSQPAQKRPEQPQPHQAPHAHSTTAIDRYLESEMRRQNIPGISLAVVKNGKPLYVKSYGVATLEHGVRTKPQTVFQIGSRCNRFTPVPPIKLANEPKLDLADPVSNHPPQPPPRAGKGALRRPLHPRPRRPQ